MDRGLSISQNREIINYLLAIKFPMVNKNSIDSDIYEIYECVKEIKTGLDNYSEYIKSIIENRKFISNFKYE